MAKLICAGHASCDLPFRPVDRRVFDVDTVFAKETKVLTGGDALNASVNLTKLGLGKELDYVSMVGDDTYGKIITEWLDEHGVNTKCVLKVPGLSSIVSVILIDDNNERHFVCCGNACKHLTEEHVIAAMKPDTEYLHLGSLMSLDGLEHEHLEKLFKYAKEHNIHTSFDVTFDESNEWFGKIEAGLPYTDIFFASYEEAISLSGGLTDPQEIADYFKKYGIKKFVLKLGKEGCFATDFDKTTFKMPTYGGFPVLDTTGAGDAFVSGYLYGLVNGLSMEECCVIGNVNGTLAVGAVGSTSGTGTIDDIKKFLKENGAITLDADALIAKLK